MTAARTRVRQDYRVRARRRRSAIALVVPFREQPEQDRTLQLKSFLRHMRLFLQDVPASESEFLVVIAEQSHDGRKFNRGQLLNAGFREAQRLVAPPAELAAVIFHDCDLLPSASLLPWYQAPPERGAPCHIAAPSTWPKYAGAYADAGAFFGGVTSFHPLDFEACNGFPNDYWGWGLEDDQLRLRVEASGGARGGVVRPPPGAGSFVDLDSVNVLRVLNRPALRKAHSKLYNSRFHSLNGSGLGLDPDWRGPNGLRGLAYEAQPSKADGEAQHPPGLSIVRVHVRLTDASCTGEYS